MFQIHRQSLRPLTTAHLAQTMTLLSLTCDELRQQIDSELASNPALELSEERRCPTCHRLLPERGFCPVCSQPKSDLSDEPVVFISPREDFHPRRELSDEYMTDEQDYSPIEEELPTYVLRQIAPELKVEDRQIAAYLLAHLNEDGLLSIEPIEVAMYYHIPLSRVEAVLHLIQRADPIGVGSRTPQQALLVQLDVLSETNTVPELARMIIRDAMDMLSHRQYSELAHKFVTPLRKIEQTVKFISENLNPYPSRSHWGDVRQPSSSDVQVYQRPDIIINYLNDNPNNPLAVEIIMPLSGTLQVNPLFRKAIQQSAPGQKEAWKDDFERASLFVKCMQQRNHTMMRLMQRLVKLQKEYIIHGEKMLHPVTRVSISKELEVHESTISRAVSGKTVQLPNRRIVPLSSFFDRSLNVRTVLRDLIAAEGQPLSDSELADILSKQGIDVARRTVAKYRAMEGILPAHLRRALSHAP
jgi:RNA polymerase sigma-54 factor